MEVRHRRKHTPEGEHTTIVEENNTTYASSYDDDNEKRTHSDPPQNSYSANTLITYNPVDLLWKSKEYLFEYFSYMVEYLWKQVLNCVPVYAPQITPQTRYKTNLHKFTR